MAISINPATHVITVPQSDLAFISGTLYQHDTEAFRLQLIAWEESTDGIWQPNTHKHNTEVTVAGITYARTIELLAPYTLQYEDIGHPGYTVMLVGSNNNLFAAGIIITNHNSIISTNSAGLIVKTIVSGSGVTEQDKLDIADRVWDEVLSEHNATGSMGRAVYDVLSAGGSLTTEQSNWLEQTYISTQKKLLTKSFWMSLK